MYKEFDTFQALDVQLEEWETGTVVISRNKTLLMDILTCTFT